MNRADHLHALLHESAAYRDPNPGRSHITGQLHALRCGALMAHHGEEAGLVGLVHDLARPPGRCWCGRWWIVDSLRAQCKSGDHLPGLPCINAATQEVQHLVLP